MREIRRRTVCTREFIRIDDDRPRLGFLAYWPCDHDMSKQNRREERTGLNGDLDPRV